MFDWCLIFLFIFDMRKKFNFKPFLILFLIVLAGVSVWWLIGRRSDASKSRASSNPDITLDEIQINKLYSLPGLNPQNTKQQKGTIQTTITRARKLTQVSVKGEPVDAPEERVFLALDLELINESSETLGFFSRDYFRLILNGKPYAPQFYNRGVAVVPVAVKNDRVAFLVDKNVKVFDVQVGELQGESEILELKFKK